MRKIKKLLFTLAVLLLLPLSVFAKDKINVYIFKGETCGYCARALEFFNGLDEEYKSYFNLVEKEVWNDKNNAALMESVGKHFNFEVKGVPFIVIGDKYFDGYVSSYDDDIKSTIKAAYNDDDYKDVVSAIIDGENLDDSSSTAFTIIIILAVVAGVFFLVYMAKDNTNVVEEIKEEPKEEKVLEKKETSPKKTVSKTSNKKTTKATSTTSKKTTSKKSTTKNKAK